MRERESWGDKANKVNKPEENTSNGGSWQTVMLNKHSQEIFIFSFNTIEIAHFLLSAS